jgi:hypothetical protein
MKSLPSGANSMSVGFVKPLTTCESVKPSGRFAAPWAGPLGKANKAPTQASNVSAISANGRRALLTFQLTFL